MTANVDDKRDKKKLGLALITVPIAIIAPTAEPAAANTRAEEGFDTQAEVPDLTGKTANPVQAATTSGSASIGKTEQLTYTVKIGDTISKIAKKFQLSPKQVLVLNDLSEKDFIFPGQKLKLVNHAEVPTAVSAASQTTTHLVRSGDTINSIAKKYSVPVKTVLAINKLSANTLIFPGQKLTIGSVVKESPKRKLPKFHVVESGETLSSIAKLYGIELPKLLAANSLTKSSLIYSGQKLQLSATEVGPNSKVAEPNKSNSAASQPSGLASADPHRPSNFCKVHGYHTVKLGESVSKIAAIYGLGTAAVLQENKLTWSSTIFVGQKLVIPGVHKIQFCPDVVKLTAEMRTNAETILSVGRSLAVSDYGIVIALATAMQESGLKNLSYGDRDSLGLFQQRPSAHWGTAEEILNPEYAARAFFGGSTSPTQGVARGLLDIESWEEMTLTQAAQAVQISAFPKAYAKWEASAWVWLDDLNGALPSE